MAGGFASGGTSRRRSRRLASLLAIKLTTAYLPLARSCRCCEPPRDDRLFRLEAHSPAAASRGWRVCVANTGVATADGGRRAGERANRVRANALAPSAIRTAENLQSWAATRATSMREDVAAAVLWLCSAEARAGDGQVIRLQLGLKLCVLRAASWFKYGDVGTKT